MTEQDIRLKLKGWIKDNKVLNEYEGNDGKWFMVTRRGYQSPFQILSEKKRLWAQNGIEWTH